MNNLVTRALSGAVFVALFSICLFLGGYFWIGLLGLLICLSYMEFYKARTGESLPLNTIGVSVLWFLASALLNLYYLNRIPLPMGYILGFVMILPVVIYIGISEVSKGKAADFNRLQYHFFGFFYIGIGFLSLAFLRNESLMLPDSDSHIYLAFACAIGVWCSDTFAYLTGRFFGKHKLSPGISPNKTIEGLLGGMLVTVLVVTCFLSVFNSICSWPLAVLYAALLSLVATLGDLVQSLWKRKMGIKDSGNILPGHGGILDRIDAQLLAAPFTLFYWILVNNFPV